MSDWIDLPGFPKTYASSCAPWGSVARLVKGVPEKKNGRPVVLSAAKGFVQRIEQEIIAGYRTNKDVAALVHGVLDAHAKHIDLAEWCRARDGEIDLSLRVYASRGSARLHVALGGPVGQFADAPLPEHAPSPKAAARPKPAKKQASAAPIAPSGAPARVAPPAAALVQPIGDGTRASYGDAIAFDLDGRLHVTLRLPNGGAYAYARIEPSGEVAIAELPSREALRADDVGAMTSGLMPALHATARGLVRIEHYDHANGMRERVGFAGTWHASRSARHDTAFTLGVRGDWFLRCIVHDKKVSVLGAHLTSGKRTKITLPPHITAARGAALDRGIAPADPDADVLRIVSGPEEHRFPLRLGPSLELDAGAATVTAHALEGAVQPLPNGDGAWVVAGGERCALRLVRADGTSTELFVLPASFTTPGYAPWGSPPVQEVHGGGATTQSWLVPFDFGADGGPRCTGALVVTKDADVLATAYVDAGGTVRCGEASLPLGQGEHVCGHAAGPPFMGRPSGELAALVATNAGLTVLWTPRSEPSARKPR